MSKYLRDALVLVALVAVGVMCSYLGERPVRAQSAEPGETWSCSVDAVAAALTQCIPTKASRSLQTLDRQQLFIVSIVAQSTTGTAGQFLLQYGTTTDCAAGTVSLFPSAATVVRIAAPANTAAPAVINFPSQAPLIVPAAPGNTEHPRLCLLGVATNTITAQISGYIK